MFFSPQPHHDRLLSVSCAAMRHSTQQSKARTRMSTTKFVAKRAHRTQYISLMSDGGATAPFVVVERTVPSGCVTVVVVDIFGRRLEGWIVRQHASEPSRTGASTAVSGDEQNLSDRNPSRDNCLETKYRNYEGTVDTQVLVVFLKLRF